MSLISLKDLERHDEDLLDHDMMTEEAQYFAELDARRRDIEDGMLEMDEAAFDRLHGY